MSAKLKEVDEMPESGQFVAMWVYGTEVWGATYKIVDGARYIYQEKKDVFVEDDACFDSNFDIRFFVVE